MRAVITLSVLPPSVNRMFFNTRVETSSGDARKPINRRIRGRSKTQAYRSWREAMGWEVKIQNPPTFDTRVKVSVELPMEMLGDADNRLKACLDLLQHMGVVTNDKLCDPVSIGRADVSQTTITIEDYAG